jgi:hypothetical protein
MNKKFVLALLLLLTTAASASPVAFSFRGDLTYTSISGINEGDYISGTVVYDAATNDGLPDDPRLGYYSTPGSFSLRAGSFARAGSINWIWLYDNYGNDPTDLFQVDAHAGNGPTWYWFRFRLLADASTGALNSDGLPLGVLDPLSFGGRTIGISTNDGVASFEITQLAPVPEPSAACLLLTGLGGVIWLTRRKRTAVTLASRATDIQQQLS